MRMFRLSFIVITFIFALSACRHTAAVSLTNIPLNRSREVEAKVYKFIFLGFNFSNDEVFALTRSLQEKCPSGNIKGILTQDQRIYYFFTFLWARETVASGFCQPDAKTASEESQAPIDTAHLQEGATPEGGLNE